eukprot:s5433_g7.t1
MQGRGILVGTQCQACLRHFRTNVRLCRHLRFTPSCRLRLQQAGFNCDVEPGVGNRKAPDPGSSQAPVLQAQGPRLPLALSDIEEERRRPVAEILDCLCHLDYDGELQRLSDSELWQRLHAAFSCVCASTDRLRLTVFAWQHSLPAHSVLLQRRLQRCAEWLLQADFVGWLVPEPERVTPQLCTFRDSAASLSLIDLSRVPHSTAHLTTDSSFCVVAPQSWESRAQHAFGGGMIFFSHEECLATVGSGDLPSFFEGPFADVCFVLMLTGLPSLETAGRLDQPERSFQSSLSAASFAGDLLRFFVHLLGRGVPAAAVLPHPNSICINAVLSLPRMQKCTGDFLKDSYSERNFRFGIREFGMGAVCNALSLDKTGIIPYCATFTIFTDYMRSAIRIAALSQAGTIFVTTHDSIAVGEDGPTHQPIETIPSLRLIPDLTVMRPADGNETAGAYKYAVERSKNDSRPTMMAFSRQALPNLPNSSIENTLKGAYEVVECSDPEVIIIGTGSEVHICVDAAKAMDQKVRVVQLQGVPPAQGRPNAERGGGLHFRLGRVLHCTGWNQRLRRFSAGWHLPGEVRLQRRQREGMRREVPQGRDGRALGWHSGQALSHYQVSEPPPVRRQMISIETLGQSVSTRSCDRYQ